MPAARESAAVGRPLLMGHLPEGAEYDAASQKQVWTPGPRQLREEAAARPESLI
jgi:hypothetical protein